MPPLLKLADHPRDRILERSSLPPQVIDRARLLLKDLPDDGASTYHWTLTSGGKMYGHLAVKRVGKERTPVVSTFLGPNMKPSGMELSLALGSPLAKTAEVKTKLLPHQQRVVDRMQEDDQPGLVVAHGLGSGKTLTSIAAQDALKRSATVVVPAALQENYRKEQAKHLLGRPQKTDIETLQRVALDGAPKPNQMLIVDEAHRARDPASATFQALKTNSAEKRMLLTGSPFYNHPADIAPLINLAAGKKLLPMDRNDFEGKYMSIRRESPGLWDKYVHGAQDAEVPILNPRRADELASTLRKWVDYHPGTRDGFPDVKREDVVVEMGEGQKKIYDTLMGEAPAWVAAKVRKGLPPSKAESASLGAFLTGPRQVANSTAGFQTEGDPESPKIRKAFENLQGMLKNNPEGRAVIYSNYLDAGINPYKKLLQEAGIAHGEFTGKQKASERDQMVRDYNEGKLRALLLSSAGGEGLDLKGTRMVQVMEPHWNEEKLKQVEGRAARFKSHEALPEDQRNLVIQRYLAGVKPGVGSWLKQKLFNSKPDQSVDQYLAMMSKNKEDLNQQFRGLLTQPGAKTAAPHHDFLNSVEDEARKRGYHMFAVVEDPKVKDGGSFHLGDGNKASAIHHARQAHMKWEGKNGIDSFHERRPELRAAEKKAADEYDEPSELRTKTLGFLGGVLPMHAAIAAHTNGLPLGAQILPHAVFSPMSYFVGKHMMRDGDLQAKALAKRMVKQPRARAEQEEIAERSGLGLVGPTLKGGLKGTAASIFGGLPILAERAHLKDPHLPAGAAIMLGGNMIGSLARVLSERDRARSAINQLDHARVQVEEGEHKKLKRLKKQVVKLEGKLSDQL